MSAPATPLGTAIVNPLAQASRNDQWKCGKKEGSSPQRRPLKTGIARPNAKPSSAPEFGLRMRQIAKDTSATAHPTKKEKRRACLSSDPMDISRYHTCIPRMEQPTTMSHRIKHIKSLFMSSALRVS